MKLTVIRNGEVISYKVDEGIVRMGEFFVFYSFGIRQQILITEVETIETKYSYET